MIKEVVITSIARTPMTGLQGGLSSLSAAELGAIAIKAALERSDLEGKDVSEVIMGEVLSAGVGQAPARQAAIKAGLPTSVPCLTINKVCGSGLKAIMLAAQAIKLGDAKIVIAGGMESMSQAPYLLPDARKGMRMGNKSVVDSMVHDGLWDPYGNAHMGNFGDLCAREKDFSREEQDAFTRESYARAINAQKEGFFESEIVPVEVKSRRNTITVALDEEPSRFKPEKIATLRPAFDREGSVTAANASKIDDGAAAVVLMSKEEAQKRGLKVLAKISADATFAQDPEWFTTAPVGAVEKALKKASLTADDIDVYEINEAFAVVSLVTMRDLKIKREKVNLWGGAVSLGHPLGCSGARILVTLLSIMEKNDQKKGCATLCIGGGEAVAMIIERD